METTKVNSNGCVSREEFEKFKTDVLTRIDRLSVEKTEQAKQIEDQKRAILDLRSMLAKYDDISSNISHSKEPPMNSTRDVTVDVTDSATHSPAHLPLKRVSSSGTYWYDINHFKMSIYELKYITLNSHAYISVQLKM